MGSINNHTPSSLRYKYHLYTNGHTESAPPCTHVLLLLTSFPRVSIKSAAARTVLVSSVSVGLPRFPPFYFPTSFFGIFFSLFVLLDLKLRCCLLSFFSQDRLPRPSFRSVSFEILLKREKYTPALSSVLSSGQISRPSRLLSP